MKYEIKRNCNFCKISRDVENKAKTMKTIFLYLLYWRILANVIHNLSTFLLLCNTKY